MPHWSCSRCDDRQFESQRALEQHVGDSSRHHVCDECQKDFASEHGLFDHTRAKHLTCTRCEKVFESAHDLANHERSPVHQPKWLKCPMIACGRSFTTVEALNSHLAHKTFLGGPSCIRVTDSPDGRPSDTLAQCVTTTEAVRRSVNTNISLSEWTRRSPASESSMESMSAVRLLAPGRSWNGSKYECILCYKTFMSLPSLDQHLRADRPHDEKSVYRCPR